jgi:hypothetical protein
MNQIEKYMMLNFNLIIFDKNRENINETIIIDQTFCEIII